LFNKYMQMYESFLNNQLFFKVFFIYFISI